ncbi:MAG: excinuclease ABC subunit UvrA [Thermoanaerobaculia bacterium]
MLKKHSIEVIGARTHNLKGVSCRIPHGEVTVVTGPSGAGKSSLAFDTVFAEGQRRFVESVSTYARQFLRQMERPPVDEIRNLTPAVALEARNSIESARSTVGTVTEIYDVLRLLFTHIGEIHCPHGHGRVRKYSSEEVAKRLTSGAVGDAILLVAPISRPKQHANQALAELIRQGFARCLVGSDLVRMDSSFSWSKEWDPLDLVLGRFKAEPGARSRLTEAIDEGAQLSNGIVQARGGSAGLNGSPGSSSVWHYGPGLICSQCGQSIQNPVPALFSFNSPMGACIECQGFGRVIGIDRGLVIPDQSLTLLEKPLAPWNSPAYAGHYDDLFAACRERGVPLDVPWRDLTDRDRDWIWSGPDAAVAKHGDFLNLRDFFARLERRSYKVHVRVMLSRYRAYDTCTACQGGRLQPEALRVLVQGLTLPEVTRMTVDEMYAWQQQAGWSSRQQEIGGHLLDELEERIGVLRRVGLDYLSLDRQARTLSGGESQRIHLAAALGSGLTSTMYVLDEPTIGLHPSDSQRLLGLLRDLAHRGNTILVVEHDRTLIEGADHLIDLGPAAGERGGEVVAEGTVEEVMRSEKSLTAKYLRDRPNTPARQHLARFRRESQRESLEAEISARPKIEVRGARSHNLAGFDVAIPLETLVMVTGVSGSGKSTLVGDVLHANFRRMESGAGVNPGDCDALLGLPKVSDIRLVDQKPLGRSSRSNSATFIKAYEQIRKILATTEAARRQYIEAAHFSFNLDQGRCAKCRGTGVEEVDMQFMAAVTVTCDSCQGKRFQRHVLAIKYEGLNIAEILNLTVDDAIQHFAGHRLLCKRLGLLVEAGLGYLRLGQQTSTLSGGEAQRLKLASFLDGQVAAATGQRRLFIFDEPTTGLHFSDIDMLYGTLRKLISRGHGVVVVEHSLDLIARGDWIIDLGPGGGIHGGQLLYSGPLVPFLDTIESPTAKELRRHLKWRRRKHRR